MKSMVEGFEGSFFDPRLPKNERFKRDPQRDYDFFMKNIPKKEDLKSLKEIEPEPDFIVEQMDFAIHETEKLKDSLVSICKTFEVVEKKDLIKKTDGVLRLFESKGFGLNEVKKGIVESLRIQGELQFSLDVHGGCQSIQLGNARAVAGAFTRLLEVY